MAPRFATHDLLRLVPAMFVAPLLVVGLTGCSDKEGQDTATTALEQEAVSSKPATAEPAPAPEESEPVTPESSPEAAPLDHGSALEAGLSGNIAIKCVYNFDDEEIANQQAFSTSGWSTPVADIYLDGTSVYWEIPQEDNRISHVLGAGISTYAWKTPGDAAGAKGDTNTEDQRGKLAALMKTHASDCALYPGPNSIFEVPDDISFDYFPG